MGYPVENLDLFKQLFLIKPSKIRKILTKICFSPKSEPHTAKLGFSVVLKHFLGKFIENYSFFVKKVTISEISSEKLRKFEKGHILRKIWICLNNSF